MSRLLGRLSTAADAAARESAASALTSPSGNAAEAQRERNDGPGERRMTDEPIDAAELAGRLRQDNLSLTTEIPEAATRIDGRLTQVCDVGAGLMIIVRSVRGLADSDICSATIEQPSAGADECLTRIGRGGRITLTGRATVSPETISRVRMHRVDTINGRTLAAIAAEDAPRRPFAAAELHRRANGGLERYARIAARGHIDGRLKDVNRGGVPAEAYATIDHVDGLDSRQFCMARLPQVDTQTKELLKSIGRGRRIRLTGNCSAEAGALAAVRMDPVERIERPDPEIEESARARHDAGSQPYHRRTQRRERPPRSQRPRRRSTKSPQERHG